MDIDELNAYVDCGHIDELIRVSEARQCKALSKIADTITSDGHKRIVLLAGGSSSGKTTTAHRLATQLRVNDMEAMHLSTDDYFVGDARNPRDENGEFDYETIECVDVERLTADIAALMRGEAVHLRQFNFAAHDGFDSPTVTSLPEGGVVILEGIHALNPRLSSAIPEESKFRLYIEPTTQPVVFATTKLLPVDARFLRRIVRDNRYRKMSPADTFRMWPKVVEGEEKWIMPFRKFADAEFDSGLIYELTVLKPFVAGLLQMYLLQNPQSARARTMLSLLACVHETDPLKVPGDSILRETIGGSQLDY